MAYAQIGNYTLEPQIVVPRELRDFKIIVMAFLPPQGASAQLVGTPTQLQLKQIRNIVRFFSRISGGPGDGPQIVRFFPGFPEVQGMVRKL